MPIIQRPNRDVLWSESGNQTEPSTEKQELGWVIEKPPYEEMNWIHYQQDLGQKYLFQRGISEWSASEDYPKDALVQYNGKYYKSLLANKGKQPDTNVASWTISFSDYSLTTEFNKVLNTTNYANNLVYKDRPIFRGKAFGTGFAGETGLYEGFGYSFVNKPMDGLFHNGDDPFILKNGVQIARFATVSDINESNKKVVTMDVLQRKIEESIANLLKYKVGDLYLTTSSENPNTILGYGTWVRFAEGRTLVGMSSSSSSNPEWTKYNGGQFGSYEVSLKAENNGKHSHGVKVHDAVTSGETNTVSSGGGDQSSFMFVNNTDIQTSGDGVPHNNVQPSVTVSIWRRTA